MAGIIMQVNPDGTSYVGHTPANTVEEAQQQLDDNGETDNGIKLVSFVYLDESNPLVRAFGALVEVSWNIIGDSDPQIDRVLGAIFEAGRQFGKNE